MLPGVLPGVELDPFDWPDEETVRLKGGKYVRFVPRLVLAEDELEKMVSRVKRQPRVYYDTETSGLNPHKGARIVGHAIGYPSKSGDAFYAWYVPVRHRNSFRDQLPVDLVSSAIERCLAWEQGTVSGHHLKFDRAMARADGIRFRRKRHDTATQANLWDENQYSFRLKSLAADHLVKGADREEEELVDWMKADARKLRLNYRKPPKGDPLKQTYLQRFGYSRTPVKMCGIYACKDVFYTWGLEEKFLPEIEAKFSAVYEREMGVSHHLHEMEWSGLDVDADEIRNAHEKISAEVDYWLSVIRHYAGEPEFKPTAHELRRLFYEKMCLDPPKRTKEGLPSADREARDLLAQQYPEHSGLMDALSKHSKAEKIRSTYSIAFLRHVTPERKIHPSYNQIERKDEGGVPVTGRLSSQDPNIQNIAKKPIHLASCRCKKCVKSWAEKGFKLEVGEDSTLSVRRYFTVPKGMVRAYIDLSQIELRVLAWLSQDERLLYCYANDLDVHQITADEVTGGDRDIAKQVNFGNNYGMTEIGLAKRLPYYAEDPERAIADAKIYLERFFKTYSGILPFRRRLAAQMRRNGNMFISPFGRPRRIPDIGSDDRGDRTRAERMMMSSIVSGTAADMMKEIMLRSGAMLERDGHTDVTIKKSIHDEIVYDMPIKGCTKVIPKLMDCFTDWPMFEAKGVPIRASCELTTTTWEAKREITINDDGTFSWAA